MMPKRVDTNQSQIVQALRDLGATVQDVHEVGRGFPDLVVGWRGQNLLVEVKSQTGRLNTAEREFHRAWRGQVMVIHTVEDVVRLLSQP